MLIVLSYNANEYVEYLSLEGRQCLGPLIRDLAMEKRTARLTLLVDPKKKEAFEKLCDEEDLTPSQKIRQFMRSYIEEKMGPDWRQEVFADDGEE